MIDPMNIALGGIQKASNSVAKAAENIADPAKQDSMVEDIVDIKVAENAFKANVAVLKTTDEMQDELLRLFDEEV